MNTFETIKKFLAEGGKCLLIENGEPIGVVLTVEEYEKLKETPGAKNPASAKVEASAELADIEAVDDVTLEDLGVDELPY